MLKGDERICLVKSRNISPALEHLAAGTKTFSVVAVISKMDSTNKFTAKDVTNMHTRLRRALNDGENQENFSPFIKQMD